MLNVGFFAVTLAANELHVGVHVSVFGNKLFIYILFSYARFNILRGPLKGLRLTPDVDASLF